MRKINQLCGTDASGIFRIEPSYRLCEPPGKVRRCQTILRPTLVEVHHDLAPCPNRPRLCAVGIRRVHTASLTVLGRIERHCAAAVEVFEQLRHRLARVVGLSSYCDRAPSSAVARPAVTRPKTTDWGTARLGWQAVPTRTGAASCPAPRRRMPAAPVGTTATHRSPEPRRNTMTTQPVGPNPATEPTDPNPLDPDAPSPEEPEPQPDPGPAND